MVWSVRGCVWVYYDMSGSLRFDVLSVSKVESTEQRVVLRSWLASLILIQEDRWASHFHAQLLDSLLVVNGQQEGLEAGLGAHCGQDGEVLRENTSCTAKTGGVEDTGEPLTLVNAIYKISRHTSLCSLCEAHLSQCFAPPRIQQHYASSKFYRISYKLQKSVTCTEFLHLQAKLLSKRFWGDRKIKIFLSLAS